MSGHGYDERDYLSWDGEPMRKPSTSVRDRLVSAWGHLPEDSPDDDAPDFSDTPGDDPKRRRGDS